MKPTKVGIAICCIALMSAALAPNLQADPWNRKSTITFSAPVEIPGVHLAGWGVLPAGTYVFKILDSQSDRHIVQIFNKEESRIYATILAIPNYRLKPTDKTVMTFHERPAGQPQALRAWFYPGRAWGEEFVYPKAKAMELARATEKPVLYTPAEIPAEVSEPIKPADVPVDLPVVAELKRTPVQAATPTGQEAPLAQAVTPPPAETQIAATPAAEKMLPATASPLPLMAVFGVLALAAAFAVRAVERRFH
jgi:hypothetical protein